MPVEHVELVHAHGFQCPQQVLHGVVVPRRVQRDPTVGIEWGIPRMHSHCNTRGATPCKLGERLKSTHGAPRSLSSEDGRRREDGECVRLVNTMNESCIWVLDDEGEKLQWWEVCGDVHL